MSDGYGCGDGYGSGCGSGYGSGYGCGSGYGYGDGDGLKVADVGPYSALLLAPWPYIRVGCEIHTVATWRARWREIMAEHSDVVVTTEDAERILAEVEQQLAADAKRDHRASSEAGGVGRFGLSGTTAAEPRGGIDV